MDDVDVMEQAVGMWCMGWLSLGRLSQGLVCAPCNTGREVSSCEPLAAAVGPLQASGGCCGLCAQASEACEACEAYEACEASEACEACEARVCCAAGPGLHRVLGVACCAQDTTCAST
jgi:hypothetical protein